MQGARALAMARARGASTHVACPTTIPAAHEIVDSGVQRRWMHANDAVVYMISDCSFSLFASCSRARVHALVLRPRCLTPKSSLPAFRKMSLKMVAVDAAIWAELPNEDSQNRCRVHFQVVGCRRERSARRVLYLMHAAFPLVMFKPKMLAPGVVGDCIDGREGIAYTRVLTTNVRGQAGCRKLTKCIRRAFHRLPDDLDGLRDAPAGCKRPRVEHRFCPAIFPFTVYVPVFRRARNMERAAAARRSVEGAVAAAATARA